MNYVLVRVYANGKYINLIYNEYFEYLSQAEYKAKELNERDNNDNEEKWIPMPIMKYRGPVWKEVE